MRQVRPCAARKWQSQARRSRAERSCSSASWKRYHQSCDATRRATPSPIAATRGAPTSARRASVSLSFRSIQRPSRNLRADATFHHRPRRAVACKLGDSISKSKLHHHTTRQRDAHPAWRSHHHLLLHRRRRHLRARLVLVLALAPFPRLLRLLARQASQALLE